MNYGNEVKAIYWLLDGVKLVSAENCDFIEDTIWRFQVVADFELLHRTEAGLRHFVTDGKRLKPADGNSGGREKSSGEPTMQRGRFARVW